jgi:hypothetical protein|nr:MAG TPA: hypothetical protein [Caudoviricetes sp.]
MRLEVFDFELNRLGLIEMYSTITYTLKFVDVGSFELKCAINKQNVKLIQKNRFLWIEDEVCGIIQYISSSTDDGTITAKGKLAKEMLNWRWVYPCFVKTGEPAALAESIVNIHCVNPSESKRKMRGLVIGNAGYVINKPHITYQKTGDTVLTSVQNISTANNLGFEIYFNPRNVNPFKFVMLEGKDRTIGNKDGNKPVVFSRDFENIVSGSYEYNDDSFRNVALVAGETADGSNNENAARTFLVVDQVGSENVSSFCRKELYVDARDLQSEYSEEVTTKDDEGNNTTETVQKKMTEQEYNATLSNRGFEKMGETLVEESYESQIRTDARTIYQFGKDYTYGDYVTVIDKSLGIMLNVQITEMQIVYDANGYDYIPTFGNSVPTILKKIKRII